MYVLDEPMSGLDPAARVAVKSVLRQLATEGRTLFFTSHVLADVPIFNIGAAFWGLVFGLATSYLLERK